MIGRLYLRCLSLSHYSNWWYQYYKIEYFIKVVKLVYYGALLCTYLWIHMLSHFICVFAKLFIIMLRETTLILLLSISFSFSARLFILLSKVKLLILHFIIAQNNSIGANRGVDTRRNDTFLNTNVILLIAADVLCTLALSSSVIFL